MLQAGGDAFYKKFVKNNHQYDWQLGVVKEIEKEVRISIYVEKMLEGIVERNPSIASLIKDNFHVLRAGVRRAYEV